MARNGADWTIRRDVLRALNVTWAELEPALSNKVYAYHEVEVSDHYKIYAYDGQLSLLCFVDKGTADATDYETNYRGKSAPISPKTTVNSIPKVAVYEPEGFFKSYVTHNLCDPTTWYQNATQVTGETLTLNTGTIYDFANNNIIDAEHGKITGEKNYSLDFNTFTFTPTIRDTYKVAIYDNGVLQTSGYTISYATGQVTFDSAPTGPVTADYYYAGSSNFKVEAAGPGKILQIRHVEIQFTEDIGFNSAIVQSIKAYNPSSPPSKIEVEHIEFLNEYDVINVGNEGKGQIIKYGTIPYNINVFPFAYGRTIDLKASEGSEINISLEGDTPMTGTFSTVTFYTTEEDEP